MAADKNTENQKLRKEDFLTELRVGWNILNWYILSIPIINERIFYCSGRFFVSRGNLNFRRCVTPRRPAQQDRNCDVYIIYSESVCEEKQQPKNKLKLIEDKSVMDYQALAILQVLRLLLFSGMRSKVCPLNRTIIYKFYRLPQNQNVTQTVLISKLLIYEKCDNY